MRGSFLFIRGRDDLGTCRTSLSAWHQDFCRKRSASEFHHHPRLGCSLCQRCASGSGRAQGVGWRGDRLAVQFVVMPPVLELFLDTAAHLEAQIGRDGDVARIEQAMNVAPKQEPIARVMFAAVAIASGPDELSGIWQSTRENNPDIAPPSRATLADARRLRRFAGRWFPACSVCADRIPCGICKKFRFPKTRNG